MRVYVHILKGSYKGFYDVRKTRLQSALTTDHLINVDVSSLSSLLVGP